MTALCRIIISRYLNFKLANTRPFAIDELFAIEYLKFTKNKASRPHMYYLREQDVLYLSNEESTHTTPQSRVYANMPTLSDIVEKLNYKQIEMYFQENYNIDNISFFSDFICKEVENFLHIFQEQLPIEATRPRLSDYREYQLLVGYATTMKHVR